MAVLALGLALLVGCSVPMDGEPPPPASPPPAPIGPSCHLESPSWASLHGGGREARAGAKGVWVFPSATTRSGEGEGAAGLSGGSGEALSCLSGAGELGGLIDGSALGERTASPLEGLVAGGAPWLFVQLFEPAPGEAFGIKQAGGGLARWDDEKKTFRALAEPLWAPDAPRFGESALLEGGFVYAYGCRSTGPLESACWVARAPEAGVESEGSYTYYAGSGRWAESLADASPVLRGVSSVSVRYHPTLGRYVAVGAPVLGRELRGFSGLTPHGPWSRPYPLAGCQVPADDEAAFCGEAVQHPGLSCPDGVAVSYDVVSLSADASERQRRAPSAYGARITCVPLGALP